MTRQNPKVRELAAELARAGDVTRESLQRALEMAERVDCVLEATYALKQEVVR